MEPHALSGGLIPMPDGRALATPAQAVGFASLGSAQADFAVVRPSRLPSRHRRPRSPPSPPSPIRVLARRRAASQSGTGARDLVHLLATADRLDAPWQSIPQIDWRIRPPAAGLRE